MAYQHITNLYQVEGGFAPVDQEFLDVLADYKIGMPVRTSDRVWPVDLLLERGVVGVYTTREALDQDKVITRTGWPKGTPLGADFVALGE